MVDSSTEKTLLGDDYLVRVTHSLQEEFTERVVDEDEYKDPELLR